MTPASALALRVRARVSQVIASIERRRTVAVQLPSDEVTQLAEP